MLFEAIYAAQRVQKNILITGMNSKSQNINGKSKKKIMAGRNSKSGKIGQEWTRNVKKVLTTGLNSTDSKSFKILTAGMNCKCYKITAVTYCTEVTFNKTIFLYCTTPSHCTQCTVAQFMYSSPLRDFIQQCF